VVFGDALVEWKKNMDDPIVPAQRRWLNKLQNFSPTPIQLQLRQWDTNLKDWSPSYFRGYVKLADYKWHNFGHADWRTVLVNELAFDSDFQRWSECLYWSKQLYFYLKMLGIPSVGGPSGGKGWHTHIFLRCKNIENVVGWRKLRVGLWNYILDEIGVPDDLREEGNGFCPTVVRFSMVHLIREFGSVKRTMKVFVNGPPGSRMKSIVPTKLPIWNVPERILVNLDYNLPLHRRKCDNCDISIPKRYIPHGDSLSWLGCIICRRG
jgi:hypothetical protein